MTALVFLASLGAIVFVVLAMEADGENVIKLNRPAGIVTWLTSGNWPAKIGGALIIVGAGALLRYALINIEIAPSLKLAAGVAIAVALGIASMLVPEGAARRPVSLALGGAAFGVAYLTSYSAFGLFKYLSDPMGIGLLGLTAVAAGVFAVTRSALSLAVLSMVGAFLAPAFALTDPGPAVVYGYYVAASALTLIMVAMRGWRPLIHLSFLFTLAGGVFLAWTASYYTESNAAVMLPMLLVLVAIHVAMPIAERRGSKARWIERLDLVYMVSLPAVAALLAVVIAPTRLELSSTLICLGVIWAAAALWLQLAGPSREGAMAHVVIATLFAVLGLAARFRDLPWEIVTLAVSVGALALAAWQRTPKSSVHDVLAGLVLLFGAGHILSAAFTPVDGPAFVNGVFAERIIGATLLIIAGAICRRIRQSLDTLLLAVGVVWASLAIGIELVRWDLATLALVIHWMLLLLAVCLWIPGRKLRIADRSVALIAAAISATAVWSTAGTTSEIAAWASLIASTLALIGLAVRPLMIEGDSRDQRLVAALLAPATAAIWAIKAGALVGIERPQFGLSIAAIVAIATLISGRQARNDRAGWLEWARDIFGVAFGAGLAAATLLHIARNPWAILFEWLCVAGLVLVAWLPDSRQRSRDAPAAMCIVGVALTIQASLMRLLGPPGDLDISAILNLRWPAVISLLWALVGSGLTIWARRTASRTLWLAGATLLVVAAVKLFLVDFGSLGQLANILAVIAAGGVFLVVGWLAPMPPGTPNTATQPPGQSATASVGHPVRSESDGGTRKTAWTIAAVVVAASTLVQFHGAARDVWRELFPRQTHIQRDAPSTERLPAVDVPMPSDEPAATTPESSTEISDAAATNEGASEVTLDTLTPSQAVAGDVVAAEVANAEGDTRRDERTAAAQPAPTPWSPPPSVDENGVRTYTQYSYPQARRPPDADPGAAIPPTPASGAEGIDQLLRQGRLRRATARDVQAWLVATGNTERSSRYLNMDSASGGYYVYRTYVVVREMTFPPRLGGANAVTFIVPRNVPRPFGDPGHSTVLEIP